MKVSASLKHALRVGLIALLCPTLVAAQDEIELITERRILDLAQFPNPQSFGNISTWLEAQREDGTWADVNYASGCSAQRANWPIQQHWNRLVTFAAAWSGVNPSISSSWKGDQELFTAIGKGLDYWFDNDYEEPDCMGNGGLDSGSCPCGTPGLWNTNWYGQAILIPQLCSATCLLVYDGDLSDSQREGCQRIPLRSYKLRDESYGTGGFMTGANMVLVMQNSVSMALYMQNSTILRDAFDRTMNEIQFVSEDAEDGIHADGSFLQHDGILYNGNYGKDLLNAFIQLEGEAIGTSYAAKNDTREALAAKVRGNEWMIFTDQKSGRMYWDFNAIGRFVAFPTVDLQASSDINFNVSKLAAATEDFVGSHDLQGPIRRLLSNGTEKLTGNKGFWASDYMVHRRDSFVLACKMLSTRSVNSEAVNGANPYGYHLGQGTLFSYVEGNEYSDIMAAWDWNLVPGTTVLLNTPTLEASNVAQAGLREFVGTVSDGKNGLAVQDYVDPLDGSLSYQKAWFFFDDMALVTTKNVTVSSSIPSDTPLITVLDNRLGGEGYAWVDGKKIGLDGETKASGRTLLYGSNGYISFGRDFNLTLEDRDRQGNWSEISTSTVGVTTLPIFSAYTEIPPDAFTYAVLPSVTRQKLEDEAGDPSYRPVSSKGVDGVAGSGNLGLAFWPGQDSEITVELRDIGWADSGSVKVVSEQPGLFLLSRKCSRDGEGMRLKITVSDPTQKETSFRFTVSFSNAIVAPMEEEEQVSEVRNNAGITFDVPLPQGGEAGSSVHRDALVRWTEIA